MQYTGKNSSPAVLVIAELEFDDAGSSDIVAGFLG
jgi:hypothetical protein